MEIIDCRRCGKIIEFNTLKDAPYFPFCSERCKLIDLGKWLDGEHKISQPLPDAPKEEEEKE
jgi:uncharacterized protein